MSDMTHRFEPAPDIGFVAGFTARTAGVSEALARAFAVPIGGFAAVDMTGRTPAPVPTNEPGPKHFSPADPATNATEGWNPFDPTPVTPPDPIAAAHAAGYAEGVAAATEERERDMALVAELTGRLGQAHMNREALARRLRQTVLYLVARLVGESGISAERLAERITAAIDLLADQAESAILRMNPADVPLIEGKLPVTVFPIGDAAVERGGFVMEAASTIVEDGPTLWLEQLAAAIDRVAVPS